MRFQVLAGVVLVAAGSLTPRTGTVHAQGAVEPSAVVAPVPSDGTSAPSAPSDGTDFTPQASTMFRVAACGSDEAVDERYPQRMIELHCQRMGRIYSWYRKSWVNKTKPFIAKLRDRGQMDGSRPLRGHGPARAYQGRTRGRKFLFCEGV